MPAAPEYGRFGRFGRFHDDGLLTLSVTPRGFAPPPTGASFQVRWGDPQAALAAVVPRIDPTEKRLSIQGGGDGAPVLIRYTLLYPGLAAVFGKRMVLHFADRAGAPLRCGVDPSRLRTHGILVVPGDRFPATPLLIVPTRRDGLKVWYDGANLTLEAASDLGEVRFVTPTGIARVPRLADAWKAAEPWIDLPVPTRTGVKAALAPDGASVTLTETFDVPVAPVSPLLALALQKGYPATLDGPLVRTGALTRWGPYAYVASRTLRTTLPVPDGAARGYVRPAVVDPRRVAQIDALAGQRDAGDAGLVAAQLAHPLPGRAAQDALAKAWSARLARAFDLRSGDWKSETEPITGHSYFHAGGSEGPGKRRVDLERGIALPLYALGVYARYSGDWKRVRALWPAAKRVRRYFELADDWAWMCAGTADHGLSTGAPDALGVVYAAALACRHLARALDDRAEEERSALWAARAAVAVLARLWCDDLARGSGQIGLGAQVVGFHETQGYLRCAPGRQDPWAMTGLLGGDTCSPDLLALYGRHAADAVALLERRYERAYPRWFDPAARYPFPVTRRGNGAGVVLPHLYLRMVVLGEGGGSVGARMDRALGSRRGAGAGVNVVAELAARQSPALLTDWGAAGYVDGVAEPGDAAVALRFRAAQAGPWALTARLRPGLFAVAATIDGAPVPVTQLGTEIAIRARAPRGEFAVRVTLSATAPDTAPKGAPAAAPRLSPGPSPRPPRPGSAGLAGGGGA